MKNNQDVQITKKPDVAAIARQKRHIHLLEKMKASKTLSRSEIRELEKFENVNTKKIALTQEDLAQIFEVSVRSIQRWIREGMPVKESGSFDPITIQRWRLERLNCESSEDAAAETELDRKLKQIKIQREEGKLKREMGEIIAKNEVEGVLAQLITAFKRSLLSLGRSLAPQLVGLEAREIDAIITAKIKTIIRDFSEGKRLFKN